MNTVFRGRGRDGSKHSDRGDARTKTLASLVGVMIVAAVIALLFVAFDSSSSSASDDSHNADRKPAGHSASHSTPVTPTTSAAPTVTSSAPTTPASSTPSSRASSSPVADSSSSTTSHSTSAKRVVYTVKKGDNLTVIAAWFHEHGYGNLYDRNKSVIGNNPNLIIPGQKIVIAKGGTMTAAH